MAKFGTNICLALLVVGVISIMIGMASGSLHSGRSVYPRRGCRSDAGRDGRPCTIATIDCPPGDICVAKDSGIDRICMPRPT